MDNWQKFEVNINWEKRVTPSDIEDAILSKLRPHNLTVNRR